MDEPLVSVILCALDQEPYIGRAIESVLNQSHRNLELIVVDDGSKDATAQRVRELQKNDARIVLLQNETNLGVPKSFNRALGKARGEYLARVDADDAWIGAEKLAKQVALLESHPQIAAVGGGMIVVDAQGKELFRYLKPQDDAAIRRHALTTSPLANSTSLVRTELARKIGGCSEERHQHEDWDFWLRIGAHGRFYNFPEYFAHYTLSGSNKSARNIRIYSWAGMKTGWKFRRQYPGFLRSELVMMGQFAYGLVPSCIRNWIHPKLFRWKKTLTGSTAD